MSGWMWVSVDRSGEGETEGRIDTHLISTDFHFEPSSALYHSPSFVLMCLTLMYGSLFL